MSDQVRSDGSTGPGNRAGLDEIVARNLLSVPGMAIYFKDRASRFIRVNVECARINGRTQDEMIGLTDFDITDHDHAGELLADERRIMATGDPLIDKEEVDRLAGRPGTWVESSKFPLHDADGATVGTFGFTRDVTRWEVAEQRLAGLAAEFEAANTHLVQVEAQLRAVLNGSTDAIAKYDRALRYQYINPAGERLRGRRLDELIGLTDRESGMAEGGVQVQEAALQQVLDSGEPLEVEYAGQTLADGDESWFHLSVSSDRDATGAVVGVLASTRDITEIKRAQQALTRQALHDPLTDLANRYLLMDRLGGALDRLGRRPGRLTLFFIDLDHFKAINDCYGHEIGDRVLVEVARRLERVARRVDTVARLGGDEYVVLCDHVMDVGVSMVAQRIVDALAVPFDDGMVAFPLSASVGASVTDNALVGASGMLHSADSAMYRAKLSGRNRFEIHQARPSGPPA